MSTQTPPALHLIIGMHRSGTSLLAQVFSLGGYDLGRSLMPPSYDNPRGFWENEKIVAAHDRLLSSFDKDWTVAAHLPDGWETSTAAETAIKDIIDVLSTDFKSTAPRLIKDPRLCVLYPLWPRVAKAMGCELHVTSLVRSPSFVVSSIVRRDSLPRERANYIALSYLSEMLQQIEAESAPIITYENMVAQSGADLISEINRHLSVPLGTDPNTIRAVDGLVFNETGKTPDDKALHTLYTRHISPNTFYTSTENLADFVKAACQHVEFDDLDRHFKNETSLLPPESHEIRLPKARLLGLEETILALRQGIGDQKTEIAALSGGIKERDNSIRGLWRRIANRDKKLAALESGISDRDSVINSLEQDVSEAREEALAARGREDATREREDALYKTYLNLEDEKAALDTAFELHMTRAERVETQLKEQVHAQALRLNYYQNYPIRAGVKAVAFRGFRLLRRALPLPESAKLALSRRFTGLALRLNPPVMRAELHVPAVLPPVESTHIDFSFAETTVPVISIIVPVYNEIAQTLACLRSISTQSVSVSYEVIIADDTSPDPLHTLLGEVKGARYFRNPENLGFLLNCNVNAAHARGEYIVLLNNDTLVNPGWLEALYQTYQDHENVGIVGSKLIFPTGELQEAGGIIWEDASGWNWGRGQSPDHPRYNYVRDVDYVSGASFMIPKALFDDIGGFYTGLEKAYYEDTDCCFRVRDRGYRVVYQPHSSLIHIEGLSSGTDVTAGAKKYQLTNQKIFHDTWANILEHHFENGTTPDIASDRTVKGHVLYIDATTPEPNKDSGSVDAVNAMRILTDLGYRVHFVPGTNFAHMGAPTRELQAMGIECVYHPFYANMTQFLKERGDMFDYVVLSRAEINDLFLGTVRKACPSAKLINNTVDLHFLRQQREADLMTEGDVKNDAQKAAAEMRKKELSFMRKTDATIVLSSVERTLLEQEKDIAGKLWTVPLIRPMATRLVDYEGSRDIVFIGGYNHPPNVDAVEWLVSDIWPKVRALLPGVRLLLCGSAMPDHIKHYASDDIIIKGFIPDLDALLSKSRLTIAPLRYGAGLKGKVASSIGAGVPCVGTSVAFEGMAESGLDAVKLQADTPQDFAELIHAVYTDEPRWEAISVAGVAYHNANYGRDEVSKTYAQMLESLKPS